MSTPTNAQIVRLLHDFYTVGQNVWNAAQIQGISNTALNTICASVKADRATVNTTHIAILAALATN